MIFQRAIRREFTQATAGIFVALFAILVSTLMIRLLGDAARGAILPEAVAALLGFSALNYIPPLLSVSAFIAILLSLSRSYRDSEMVVWFSSGISLSAWVRPVLVFMAPLILVIGALSMFVSPWALSKSAEYRGLLETRKDTGQVRPGTFQESSSGDRVVFVEAISEEDAQVRNVFVSSAKNGQFDVTMAATGYQEFAENGDRFVVLENGSRYELTADSPEFRVLEYGRYAIRLETKEARRMEREVKPNQMPLQTLLQGDHRALKAELLWRISMPLSAIVLSLLAIPLSFVNPRAGRSANMLFALCICLLYNNLITIGESWVSGGKLSFLTGLFAVHLTMLSLLPLLFFRRIAVFSFSRFFR